MTIFGKLLTTLEMMMERRRQARVERDEFRMIVARGDDHLLRDIGLTLAEGENAIHPFGGRSLGDRRFGPHHRTAASPRKRGDGIACGGQDEGLYCAFSPERPPASWTSFRNSAR